MTEQIDHKYWAKEVLKYLVNRVRKYNGGDKFIYYGKLANEIDYPKPYSGSVFGQRIGATLGEMGHVIEDFIIDGERPPYIQALVVTTNTGLPGDGIKEFFEDYPSLPKEKKKDLLMAEYQRIFEFGSRWEKLLEELKISLGESSKVETHGSSLHNPYGSEGSPEHKAVRDFVYNNPQILGLSPISKYKEYPLKSGDFVDVLFETEEKIVGIEVKSKRSGRDDIERGIYQCIKYKAVLTAENMFQKNAKVVECVLVLEAVLPQDLRRIKDKLGVLFRENVWPSNNA